MNKKITITALIIFAVIMLLSGGVQAYQSIPTGTATTAYAPNWIAPVRRIEASTGGMGLSETLDTTTLLGTTASNNIDVHMQKNTEYGAAVLLSASAYGKQGNGTTGSNYVHTSTYGLATSTGNVYGIYELGQGTIELVAGGKAGGRYTFISNDINARYINRYREGSTAEITGDATYTTRTWHGGTYAIMPSGSVAYGMARGSGSSFGYDASINSSRYAGASRAVIVSGTGF